MRRIAPAILLAACGSFGSTPDATSTAAPDAGADASGTDAHLDDADADAPDAAIDAPSPQDASYGGHAPCNGATACERYVFVTKADYVGGKLGSAADADAKCKGAADASSRTELHGRSWNAWLSDATGTADAHVVHGTKPYRVLDGSQVIASYSMFAKAPLDHPINQDEEGALLNSAQVWTGSQFNGTATSDTCQSWTSIGNSDFGTIGNSSSTNSGWSNSGSNGCAVTAHLYCFEN